MKPALRRRIAIASGLSLGVISVGWLSSAGCERLRAPGPMIAGHRGVECESCHREAPGNVRQQLQNAARHAFGGSDEGVDIGYRKVSNDECLACHQRPADRHPVFRFLEPRFARVREAIAPEQCSSCHLEHRGAMVTVGDPTYCRNCHSETAVANDPLDVSHRELVASERWDTCLGCHDFHGNHAMKPARSLAAAISPDRVRAYLAGGPSPYGDPIVRAVDPKDEP